jgi:hypothetical protein
MVSYKSPLKFENHFCQIKTDSRYSQIGQNQVEVLKSVAKYNFYRKMPQKIVIKRSVFAKIAESKITPVGQFIYRSTRINSS